MIHLVLYLIAVLFCFCSYCLIKRRELRVTGLPNCFRALSPHGWKQVLCCIALPVSFASVTWMYDVFYDLAVLHTIKRLALLTVMWPIAVTDFREMRIPNKLILIGLFFRGLLIFPELFQIEAALAAWRSEAIAALVAAVLALVCVFISGGSMGMGDVKLMIMMGLCLGGQGLFYSMFFSIFIAFFFSIIVLILRKKHRKDAIPFAPFILIGTWISLILSGT